MRFHLPALNHGVMDPAPAPYMIRINGHLGAMVLSAFPAMASQRHGTDTVLTGLLDRSALYGVLAEIEALGLDLLADHLLTPENAAFLLIDYQPSQLAGVRSMDRDLLVKNAVSTVKTIKTFEVPVVHSTINVASGQGTAHPPRTRRPADRRQATRPDHDQLLEGPRIRPGRPRGRPPQAHPLRPVDRNLHGLHRPRRAAGKDMRSTPSSTRSAAPRRRPTAPALT